MATSVIPPVVLASGATFTMPRDGAITGIVAESDNGATVSLKRNGVKLVAMPGGATNDIGWVITSVAIKVFEGDVLLADQGPMTLIFA